MSDNESGVEADGTLTSKTLAELIIDGLVMAKLLTQEQFDHAVEIAEEEINVRKAMGDY